MKGKYKDRTSRVTPKEALYSCPSWAGQEPVKLALRCQTPKDHNFRQWKRRRDAGAFLPSLLALECLADSRNTAGGQNQLAG